MSKIATVNTSDKIIIVSPREGYIRKSKIGTAWTDVRIGMLYTFVPYDNDDAACMGETLVETDYRDFLTFGLKDSSAIFPGAAGSKFIGMRSTKQAGTSVYVDENNGNAGKVRGGALDYSSFATWDGTTELAVHTLNVGTLQFPQWASGTVNAFVGLRFQVANIGTGTQTIQISYIISPTGIATVTKANLKTLLQGSYTNASTPLAWNAAGAALALPEYFWIRSPFNLNRIRITTYGVLNVP